MKRKITLLIVCVIISFVSFAQYRNYKIDNGWNIGFNTGGTWQEKEAIVDGVDTTLTQPFTSIRGGFTFGKALYEEEGAIFAFDLRFRYLRGINYGWAKYLDTISSPDINPFVNDFLAYKNYRMDLNEFSLEGVLTLNSLLENTGIILYGFGGIGLVDYRVKTDYLFGSNPYDYPDLIAQNDRMAARTLKDNSDLQFESNAPGVIGNQLKVMPSLGFGFGYQFNEVFSMGFEHKLTYAFNNKLDGIFSDEINDKYHYTAIKMSFNILDDGTSYEESNEMFQDDYYSPTVINKPPPTINTTSPTTTPTETPTNEYIPKTPPTVNIVNPANNYLEVNSFNYTINAELTHVESKQNISFFLNGVKQPNYLFNYNSNIFTANIQLQSGENKVEIIGQNQDGSALDKTTLNYTILSQKRPPIVSILNPADNPYLSNIDKCLITAEVKNVFSKSQIKFYVNSKINTSFTFSSNGIFKSNVSLNNGTNLIHIIATNDDGTAKDSTTLFYEKRIVSTPPDVVITSPETNPHQSKQQNCTIKAFASNIDSKQQLVVRWNNKIIHNYSFNTVTKQITFNGLLNEGNNYMKISAQNEFGSDSENITINYQKKIETKPPNIIIEFPSESIYSTTNQVIQVKGKIYNVSSTNNTTSIFNTKPAKYFDFNPNANDFQTTLNLVPGANIFTVSASNKDGSDSKTVTINYNPIECSNPAINMLQPQSNNITTTNSKAYIKMQVLNTQNIEFQINGISSSGYNFDVNTGIFSSMINLKIGTTVYTLSATNDCGTATKTITYQFPQNSSSKENQNKQNSSTIQKAEQEKAAQEKAAQQKAAQQKAAQQKAAQEKAAQQKAAQEKAAQEKAAQEKAAQQKAAQEKAAQQKAAQEKAAQEKAAQEKAAQEKAAQEKAAQEKAAQQKAAQEKAAQEKAAQEKAAKEANKISPKINPKVTTIKKGGGKG